MDWEMYYERQCQWAAWMGWDIGGYVTQLFGCVVCVHYRTISLFQLKFPRSLQFLLQLFSDKYPTQLVNLLSMNSVTS